MIPDVLGFVEEALWLVLILSAPPIAAASLVGLAVSFIQAATQMQEQTFSFAVKLLVIVLTLFLTATLLGGALYNFAERLFLEFPQLVRR